MQPTVYIEIETAIRKASWATVQVGRKSLQRLTIDFDRKTVANQFLTGTTKILWLELGSIRDNFQLTNPRFNNQGTAYFAVSGETASGVHIMPNINYHFDFEVSPNKIKFSGAHDGYPSYNIAVNGRSIYDYPQGYIWELVGDSEVKVQPKTVPL
jgi:hypothetical protein